MINVEYNVVDLRPKGLTKQITQIIESNTGTQVNKLVGYTELDWANGIPSVVRKYVDSSKSEILYTITLTWTNGVPTNVERVNHDDGITENLILTWSSGLLQNVEKV